MVVYTTRTGRTAPFSSALQDVAQVDVRPGPTEIDPAYGLTGAEAVAYQQAIMEKQYKERKLAREKLVAKQKEYDAKWPTIKGTPACRESEGNAGPTFKLTSTGSLVYIPNERTKATLEKLYQVRAEDISRMHNASSWHEDRLSILMQRGIQTQDIGGCCDTRVFYNFNKFVRVLYFAAVRGQVSGLIDRVYDDEMSAANCTYRPSQMSSWEQALVVAVGAKVLKELVDEYVRAGRPYLMANTVNDGINQELARRMLDAAGFETEKLIKIRNSATGKYLYKHTYKPNFTDMEWEDYEVDDEEGEW